jgi:hypothetical protein
MATLNVKFPLKYYSDSQGKWVDTQVVQVATDGSIEVLCKPGVFQHIQNIRHKLKLKNNAPIPDEFLVALQSHPSALPKLDATTHIREPSGLTPDPKRSNANSEFATGSTSGTLPQYHNIASPMPNGPQEHAQAPSHRGPGSVHLPPGFDSTPNVPASLEQIQALLQGSEDRITQLIGGLDHRVGQRLDDHEQRLNGLSAQLAKHDEHSKEQDERIDTLQRQMSALGRSSSMPANMRLDPENEKKAFLGGFPQRTSISTKTAAQTFIGNLEGVEVEVMGNVNTGAIVVFSSSEAMHKFIKENEQRAKDAGLFLKPNRGPLSQEERNRKQLIWQGKQALIRHGIAEDLALFSRGCFWIAQPDGNVMEVGKLNGNKIDWNEAAPENIKGA